MKDICKRCNGKGNPFCPYNSGFCPKDKKPQTNEEWFCSLPTEEKVKVLVKRFYKDEPIFVKNEIARSLFRWLNDVHKEMDEIDVKQPHTNKE